MGQLATLRNYMKKSISPKPLVHKENCAIPEFIRKKKNNWFLNPLVIEKVAKSIEKQMQKIQE